MANPNIVAVASIYGESVGYNLTATTIWVWATVLRIIKLNLFPVPVRLQSGFGKLKIHRYITIMCDI